MKKKIKISFIATCIMVLLWIPQLVVYEIAYNPEPHDKIPFWFASQLFTLLIFWSLLGIYYLIKHFAEIKKEVFKFINE